MTGPTFRAKWRDAIRLSTAPELDDTLTVMVAMALDHDMSADGHTKAGVRRLARLARCNKDTAADRVARLTAAGWLRRHPRGGYQATRPDATEVSGPVGQSSDGEVSGPVGQSSDGECPTGAAEVSDGAGRSVRPGRTVPGNHVPGNHGPVASSSGGTRANGGAAAGEALSPEDDLDDLTERLAQRITAPPHQLGRDENRNAVAALVTAHGIVSVRRWILGLHPMARWPWPSDAFDAADDAIRAASDALPNLWTDTTITTPQPEEAPP